MKKLLLSILTVLVIILTAITMIKGLKIGNINILGIMEMKQKNEELDTTVKEATKLASTDYQKRIDDLNDAVKELETEKIKYEDNFNTMTESSEEAATITYKNNIEFLFVRIGNHAKTEGVSMNMVVANSSSGEKDAYNLSFTTTGSYVGIEEFLTDIEDDSQLGYKIEEFKMLPSSEGDNIVQATFVCKNITIEGISSNSASTSTTTGMTNTISSGSAGDSNTTNSTTNTTTSNTTK